MRFGSLFAGIGGFDLGLERAGMECAWQVEIDDFCNKVLEKHWPNVRRYRDVMEVGKHNLEPVDLICGGFPCQPFSVAGKRAGKEDDRHLWPKMFRVIQELKPRWVIGENVSGFINMGLDESISDLEGEGYEVQTLVIPACAVNAPHRRDRVWIIAHTSGAGAGSVDREIDNKGRGASKNRGEGIRQTHGEIGAGRPIPADGDVTDPQMRGCERGGQVEVGEGGKMASRDTGSGWDENWVEVATRLCRVDDGVPGRVDRLKSLGNAVVPQIVEIIGRTIMEIECEKQ